MQMNEIPRSPTPAAAKGAPPGKLAKRPAARQADVVGQEPDARKAAAVTPRKPPRFGAGF
jgi:hypothetical protein